MLFSNLSQERFKNKIIMSVVFIELS
ncbi:uncharacterized protein METZ01_LOCUS34544 [marine metagenome]|uniref:Uncharacterized protein n=1 Tax=marine metagenome TaxID=408172 RepID=A0A381QRF5_9ZZZZ